MEKLGLIGGTFDPIHFGHLNLALSLKEAHGLDRLLFCPALVSPTKQPLGLTPAHHRLRMVKLAIEDIKGCEVLDLEIRRKSSYTIDTLTELSKRYPSEEGKQVYLLMGLDVAYQLPIWHEASKIIETVPILVGRRAIDEVDENKIEPKFRLAIEKGLTKIPLMEISATAVRERLKKGLPCEHLVPKKVLSYIYENNLYV